MFFLCCVGPVPEGMIFEGLAGFSAGLKKWAKCVRMERPFMSAPEPEKPKPAESAGADATPPNEPAAPEQLSKEEQWALFEKELKESDWGHQPC